MICDTAREQPICDTVREQPDGKDDPGDPDGTGDTADEELDLDPRVEGELDSLNKSSNEINILEKELDEARAVFRQRLTDAARSLKQLAKSLGNSIDKARPYFEAFSQAKKAQLECQNAAMTYERACQLHKGARETISSAEEKLMHKSTMFDQAWQEMLNSANTKILEAEKEKMKNEEIHLEAALAYRELEARASQLERQLRKSVNKARPYFEQRTIYLGCLETQKSRVLELETAYMAAKTQYSKSLRNLEIISEDIHRKRSSKNSSVVSTPSSQEERQGCVGAEKTDTITSVRRRLNSEEALQRTLQEHQRHPIPLGRYRSSLLLDLDMDIDLSESIDFDYVSSKSPSVKSVDVGCVKRKHYDDYQVLDIMPFLEKENERKKGLKNSASTENNEKQLSQPTDNTAKRSKSVSTDYRKNMRAREIKSNEVITSNQVTYSRQGSCSENNENTQSRAGSSRVSSCKDTDKIPESLELDKLRVDGNGQSITRIENSKAVSSNAEIDSCSEDVVNQCNKVSPSKDIDSEVIRDKLRVDGNGKSTVSKEDSKEVISNLDIDSRDVSCSEYTEIESSSDASFCKDTDLEISESLELDKLSVDENVGSATSKDDFKNVNSNLEIDSRDISCSEYNDTDLEISESFEFSEDSSSKDTDGEIIESLGLDKLRIDENGQNITSKEDSKEVSSNIEFDSSSEYIVHRSIEVSSSRDIGCEISLDKVGVDANRSITSKDDCNVDVDVASIDSLTKTQDVDIDNVAP